MMLAACGPAAHQDAAEVRQVEQTFASFKSAIFGAHAAAALAEIDQPSLDYLDSSARCPPDPSAPDAELRQVIYEAVARTTPGGAAGPGFKLEVPLQRILNQGCMNTHALDSIQIGPVTIDGAGAHAEVLWENMHTTYRLAFVKQAGQWKVDLLGVVPYIEIAMRVGRTLRNESAAQQVDRLVSQFPAH
jgi:hypothetical protein